MTRDERALVATLRRLAAVAPERRRQIIRGMSEPQRRALDGFWPGWAHPGQAPPAGDWATWTILAGRGFGKTRAGAEWVSGLANADGRLRFALVGASIDEVRAVMVEGPSGILAVARAEAPVAYRATWLRLVFASGAQAAFYSGAHPERLRGAQHHHAWCDEIAKWRAPERTWDNLRLGLRMSKRPRILVTTTPKPMKLLDRLSEADTAAHRVTRGRTRDNLNLPPAFVEEMAAAYGGTRLGRQELDGELLRDAAGALWSRSGIERCRTQAVAAGALRRIVIGVDPPGSAGGDLCGIVVCGVDTDDIGHVLADLSVGGLTPEGWAGAVVRAAEAWAPDCVVVEKNQGGEMALAVLRAAAVALPIRPAHARFGKGARAEPVGLLFEQGRARFAGRFPELEDELCRLTARGYDGGGSPDRADAMVWAMTELMLGRTAARPRVLVV